MKAKHKNTHTYTSKATDMGICISPMYSKGSLGKGKKIKFTIFFALTGAQTISDQNVVRKLF